MFLTKWRRSEKNMPDTLSEQMKSRLNLKTKTVGDERVRRARETNEDVAILSMEWGPGEKSQFKCSLGSDCLVGDPTKLPLGETCFYNASNAIICR